jgi:hypothetical protein
MAEKRSEKELSNGTLPEACGRELHHNLKGYLPENKKQQGKRKDKVFS